MPTSARYLRLPAAEPSPPSMPSVSPSSAALSPPDRDAKPSSTSPALVRTLTKAPLEWGAWLDAAIGSVIAAGAPRSPPYKLAALAAARQSVLKPPTMPPPEGGEQLPRTRVHAQHQPGRPQYGGVGPDALGREDCPQGW